MITRRTLTITAAFASAGLLVATQAAAHAQLVSSNPAANATVAAPKTITLTFNEKVTPAFSGFEVAMVGHDMKVPVAIAVSRDGKTVTGTPRGSFMAGSYRITWHAATSDGHRINGTVDFKVG